MTSVFDILYESLSVPCILPVIRVVAYTHHDAGRGKVLAVGDRWRRQVAVQDGAERRHG